MDPRLYFVIGFLVVVTLYLIARINTNRSITTRIINEFGVIPNLDYNKVEFDLMKEYYILLNLENPIDDNTWNDLDMDRIFHRINNTQSIVGDEYLYAHLRRQRHDNLQHTEATINYFKANPKIRIAFQRAFRDIGKDAENGLIKFLYHPVERTIPYQWIYTLQRSLAIVSPLAFFIGIDFGIVAVVAIIMANFITYNLSSKVISKDARIINTASYLLQCAKKLTKYEIAELSSELHDLKEVYRELRTIKFVSPLTNKGSDYIAEVFRAFYLTDFLAYNHIMKKLFKHSKATLSLYQTIGYLETCISILSYRQSVRQYSTPHFSDDSTLCFEEMVHPLVKTPTANSASFNRNILITGSNASGKSTFIKAIALNAILAQSINTCLAKQFTFKPCYVMTSMAIADDIISQESYFIKEIKSIKRLFDAVKRNDYTMVFIDEILRGTNTIERIAASSAIMKALNQYSCFVCVATHDIELTQILDNFYGNYHFREFITTNGIEFSFKLYEGKSMTKNAIKLLEYMNYDEQVVADAASHAQEFEETQKWPTL